MVFLPWARVDFWVHVTEWWGGGAFYELPGAPQSVQLLLLLFSFGLKANVGTQVKNLNSLRRDPSLSEGNEDKITPSHLTK